ncbi:MAG: YggS family pyridoxal phosphate-dependent enzyme [Anaerolineales bacterium]|nr:YggS family pyridoxal phosphate-dependent enzyme [Anaerolineales bacterium]
MEKHLAEITESAKRILNAVPPTVTVVAAAKGRNALEIEAAIDGGITCVGHNYVQDAWNTIPDIDKDISWHMIGHLQRNKINKAVQLFDMIESLDSLRLAKALDKHCAAMDIVMPILIEINSGREPAKTGVPPEEVSNLLSLLAELKHIQVEGLMTMGPRFGDPELARPYFQTTRNVFEAFSARKNPNTKMHYLSMGMSNTYQIAIEEGANVIRIGSAIFGSPSK